jgi:glycine cleavage system H protein
MAKARFKKSALPEDLRYSREKVWVAPTGVEGRYRLGLAFPAFGDERQTAYFVDCRRRGALVAQKPFGFIDIETGRIELVAPLSGRIVAANHDLADDPAIVSRDPFAGGWLVEIDRVPPGLVEKLYDRDGFYAYLQFEMEARRLGLAPTLGARYRLDDGDPWPQELRVELGGRLILRSRAVKLGRNETFTPQWTAGDAWRVRCEILQPSTAKVAPEFAPPRITRRTWQFEVIDDQGDAAGTPCYVVKAIEVDGAPPQSFFRLSIAKADFTLRLIEEQSVHDALRGTRTPNAWGAEGWVELRQPRELILDLPLFPAENRDEKRVVAAPGCASFMQETRFPDAKTMAIACDAQAGDDAVRSEQVWERGLPWWRSARRLVGGAVVISGELVT